jgi:hypothetical protein
MNWAKEFDKFVGKASKPKRVVVRKGGEEGKQKIKGFIPLKQQHSEGTSVAIQFHVIPDCQMSVQAPLTNMIICQC